MKAKLRVVTVKNAADLEYQGDVRRLLAIADALIMVTGGPGKAFGLLQRLERVAPLKPFLRGSQIAPNAQHWIVEEEIVRQSRPAPCSDKKGER